jgi:rubrerythrin
VAGVLGTMVALRHAINRHEALLRRERERREKGLCPACGYDLTGNASGMCPECGRGASKRPIPPRVQADASRFRKP